MLRSAPHKSLRSASLRYGFYLSSFEQGIQDAWNLGAPILGGMRILGFLGQDASDFGRRQSGLAQIYPQAKECGIALALGR